MSSNDVIAVAAFLNIQPSGIKKKALAIAKQCHNVWR
jgi:hypothetical protein